MHYPTKVAGWILTIIGVLMMLFQILTDAHVYFSSLITAGVILVGLSTLLTSKTIGMTQEIEDYMDHHQSGHAHSS